MTKRYIRIGTLASRPNRPGMLPVCDKTILRWVAAGDFPAPLQLAEGTKVWDLDLVNDFLSKKSDRPSPPGRGARVVALPHRNS